MAGPHRAPGAYGARTLARHDESYVRCNYECKEACRNGPMVIEHQQKALERRRLCLGETNTGRLLTFVVTDRKGNIRFVTAYPMRPKQRAIYRGEEE